MDYNEFATKIKTKYPDYADMDNRELAQKMVAKFPEYSDVTFDQSGTGQSEPWINRAADVSSGIQSAVMDPLARGGEAIARGLSNVSFGTDKPIDYLQQGIGAVGRGIQAAEGGAAEWMGSKGVNPYVSAALPIAGEIAATMLIPGSKSATGLRTVENATSNLAKKATASADSRWFKASGGTLANAKELGAEEALRLGRYARENKYVTPLNSPESRQASIESGMKQSGKRLEELRGLGDLYGDSPEAKTIAQAIEQDLGPKYASGVMSGESGELRKAIDEVLKLEPVDKLTRSEELAGYMGRDIPTETGSFKVATPGKGEKTIQKPNQNYPLSGPEKMEVPNPDYTPGTERTVTGTTDPYEIFRRTQEDPNYIPEYDLRRPTTFNEVAKVATKINKYAGSQSKLLQPSGAATDVANLVSEKNNSALMNALPKSQGAEYQKALGDYSNLSKLDRMNELALAYEAGASRNSIVNNIANRIYHKFGHQLSAEAMDKIAGALRQVPRVYNRAVDGATRAAAYATFIDKVTTKENAK